MKYQVDRIEALIRRVIQLDDSERKRYLQSACEGDAALEAEVLRRLDLRVDPLRRPSSSPALSAFAEGAASSRYRLGEQLGEGGNGVVFRAEDLKLQRTVALKFLRPETDDEEHKARLLREAQAAASLAHPNICVIHEVDESESAAFIAMEFVEGENVRQKTVRQPFEIGEALDITIQAAEGLRAAHESDIVHRDVKSANIMVTPRGQVKVMDFGLARLGGGTRITKSGIRLGTPAYMSPEQAIGEDTDRRTDIWSLGVVLYEMVSGKLPFKGEVDAAVAYSIVHALPEPLTALRHGLPVDLDLIVEKALAKDPNERYQYLDDFLVDLQALRAQLEPAAASGGGRQASGGDPPIRRVLSAMGLSRRLDRRAAQRSALRRRQGPLFSTASSAAGIGIAVVLLAVLFVHSAGLFESSPPGAPAVDASPSVAVLPLAALGGEAELQAFADGLTETVTRRLSQFEGSDGGLLVAPPSEVRRQKVASPAAALAKLGATYAVEGSLQSEGDRVRLVLTVVDTQQMKQVDTAVIDGFRVNALSLQDGAVAKLSSLLNLSIGPKHATEYGEVSPASPGAYEFYLQGRGYLQRSDQLDNINSAIEVFQESIAEDNDYAPAHAGLCEAYWLGYERTSDTQWVVNAQQSCSRALELDDRLALAHITMGTVHRGTGQYGKALLSFQKALDLDSRSSEAYGGLARAYEALGETEQAEKTFQTAVRLKPSDWSAYKQLGLFYYRHADYDRAIAQYRQVIRLTPDSAHGYTNLGTFFYRLGDFQQAETMWVRSIDLEPRSTALSNLARLLSKQNRLDEAAARYREAIALKPENHVYWANLASLSRKLGHEEEASEQYQKAIAGVQEALSVNARDPRLLADLAHYAGSIGRTEQATEAVTNALVLEPDDPDTIILLAEVSERLGNRNQAVQLSVRAFELGYSRHSINEDWNLSKVLDDPRYAEEFARYSTQ